MVHQPFSPCSDIITLLASLLRYHPDTTHLFSIHFPDTHQTSSLDTLQKPQTSLIRTLNKDIIIHYLMEFFQEYFWTLQILQTLLRQFQTFSRHQTHRCMNCRHLDISGTDLIG